MLKIEKGKRSSGLKNESGNRGKGEANIKREEESDYKMEQKGRRGND